MIPKLLTVREFAERAGVSDAAVYKRIRLHQLKATKVFADGKPSDESGKQSSHLMIFEDDLSDFVRRPRKSRRTITVSPALSKAIDDHLQEYGNISKLLEDGAWLLFYMNGVVDLATAVENISSENAGVLVKVSTPCDESV